MNEELLTTAEDQAAYDSWFARHAARSLWQSPAWRRLQEHLERTVRLYALRDSREIRASAMVIIDRSSRGGVSTWDIPRGPLWAPDVPHDALQRFLEMIVSDAKKAGALHVTYSPPTSLPFTVPLARSSKRLVQPQATRLIPLAGSEEDMLARMKQKGRYNIRLAEKHGIRVEESKDAAGFAHIAKKTSQRDKFTSHGERFYQTFLDALPGSFLLLAYQEGQTIPIAGLIGVIWEGHGIYYYGASDHDQRHLMAPYLLQWEAMKRCKAAGCVDYDLFGIAPADVPGHPWAGITQFKEKFGGEIVTYPSEQEMVLRPVTRAVLKIKRKILG
jgi:lipid II:glycine glycyltransferase (peptidoglycan interpeptide bridge formation enzyme)